MAQKMFSVSSACGWPALERGFADRAGRIQALGRHAIGFAEDGAGVDQALAAADALGRGVAVAADQAVHHGALARGGRRQRDMPALAFQRHPAAAPVGQQARHAQPGAGANQAHGHARHRRAAADLAQLVGRQVRQGQRQRGEVVEQAQRAQAELGLHRRL
jgi:hypothetical protein